MPREPKSGPVPANLQLQYLIVLAGTDPLVWRRIRIPATYTFWDLHVAIQDSMGWLDYHLHLFRVLDPASGTTMLLGIPDPDEPGDRSVSADWGAYPLDYTEGHAPTIDYIYDFGDNWRHAVIFEGFEQGRRRATKPECLAGGGACPPEDCGGPHGYRDVLAILADAEHPDFAETAEWVGGVLDPATFNPKAVGFDDPRKRWRLAFEGDAG